MKGTPLYISRLKIRTFSPARFNRQNNSFIARLSGISTRACREFLSASTAEIEFFSKTHIYLFLLFIFEFEISRIQEKSHIDPKHSKTFAIFHKIQPKTSFSIRVRGV